MIWDKMGAFLWSAGGLACLFATAFGWVDDPKFTTVVGFVAITNGNVLWLGTRLRSYDAFMEAMRKVRQARL